MVYSKIQYLSIILPIIDHLVSYTPIFRQTNIYIFICPSTSMCHCPPGTTAHCSDVSSTCFQCGVPADDAQMNNQVIRQHHQFHHQFHHHRHHRHHHHHQHHHHHHQHYHNHHQHHHHQHHHHHHHHPHPQPHPHPHPPS